MLDFCITGFAQHMKKYKSSCITLSTERLPESFTHEAVPYLGIKLASDTIVAESPHSSFFVFYSSSSFLLISISWNKTNKKQNNDKKILIIIMINNNNNNK